MVDLRSYTSVSQYTPALEFRSPFSTSTNSTCTNQVECSSDSTGKTGRTAVAGPGREELHCSSKGPGVSARVRSRLRERIQVGGYPAAHGVPG
eukprot:1512211-Rhodomonas_salina.1